MSGPARTGTDRGTTAGASPVRPPLRHAPARRTFLRMSHPATPLEGLHLRRATSEDVAWLAEFGARTFRAAFAHLTPEDEVAGYCAAAYGVAQQAEELQRAHSIALIAELDAARVGFAWVLREDPLRTPPCVTDPDAVHLSRIYIDPAVQNHGVGSRLIEGALAEARGLGGETLWLAVWEKNPRAIAFYQRHHFSEIGRAGFPTDPDPACDLIMARWLGPCC